MLSTDEFYCGSCGRFKHFSLMAEKRGTSKKPTCTACVKRFLSLKSETARYKTRASNAKKTTMRHLIPDGA